jgi:hypothetical protein
MLQAGHEKYVVRQFWQDNKTMHTKPDLRVPIEAMISVPAR